MQNKTATTSNTSAAVATLDRLLRGERSAVATYEQAQSHLKGEYAAELETNRACHAERVDVLTQRIIALGGKPTVEGGAWVGFTKAIESSASVLGTGAVIAALEQGEDIGLNDYRNAIEKAENLDAASRTLVVSDLLVSQQETHALMREIKKSR